jgi:transposase
LTGANTNDGTQLIPLVDAIPPVRGKPGAPRRRPQSAYGDRAYYSRMRKILLHARGIEPRLAKPRTAHGSGLGRKRWVIERTLSWLHQFRRLRVRYDRRADIHEAFLTLGCALICWKKLPSGFC